MLKEYSDLFFGNNEQLLENTSNYYYPRAEYEVQTAHSTDFKETEKYPSHAEMKKSREGTHFPSPSFSSVVPEERRSLSDHPNPSPLLNKYVVSERKWVDQSQSQSSNYVGTNGSWPLSNRHILPYAGPEEKPLSNYRNTPSKVNNYVVSEGRPWVDHSHSQKTNYVGTNRSWPLSNHYIPPHVGPGERPLSNHRNTPTFNNYVVSEGKPWVNQIHSQLSNYVGPKESRPLSNRHIPPSLNHHVVPEKTGPSSKRCYIRKRNSPDTDKKEKKVSSMVLYDKSQDSTYSSNRSPKTAAKNSDKRDSPFDTLALPWYGD